MLSNNNFSNQIPLTYYTSEHAKCCIGLFSWTFITSNCVSWIWVCNCWVCVSNLVIAFVTCSFYFQQVYSITFKCLFLVHSLIAPFSCNILSIGHVWFVRSSYCSNSSNWTGSNHCTHVAKNFPFLQLVHFG